MSVLDNYVKAAPSAQNALDIFKDEWVSKLPGRWAALQAGTALLFEDPRIEWGLAELGGVDGKRILELGPLEAGHTYMLERLGAAEVVSVEANTRAYLKCLIIAQLVGLRRAQFLCGDFVEYLRANDTRFDVCLASGVLYHMRDPVELMGLAARASDRLFLWTHYYDERTIAANPALAAKFTGASRAEHGGFAHTVYRQEYQAALQWPGFCGGNDLYSHWLSRDDIVACLRHLGLSDIRISFEQPDHPNGPSLALTAARL